MFYCQYCGTSHSVAVPLCNSCAAPLSSYYYANNHLSDPLDVVYNIMKEFQNISLSPRDIWELSGRSISHLQVAVACKLHPNIVEDGAVAQERDDIIRLATVFKIK